MARTPVLHLNDRDGWIIDSGMEACVHLMVQTMETWIVADPDALEIYYQPRFRASALPRALNLESVSKVDIEMALDEATKDTQKGKYKKIRHAKDLLARIDAEKVNSRCPHSKRFFEYVKSAIDRHPG